MRPFHFITIVLFITLLSCNENSKHNINEKASVSALDVLPENPLLLSPITFSINPKKALCRLYTEILLHFSMQKRE